MNKKERVVAAINKQAVDHVPASFSLHFEKGMEYGELAVQAHMDFFRRSGCDILKIMNENLVPEIGEMNGPEDWNKVPLHTLEAPFMQRQVDLVKRLVAESKQDNPYVLATIHGICASGIHPIEARYGYVPVREMLVNHFRENKKPMLDAFDRISDAMCALSVACIEAGAHGIYYAALGGERHFFTDDEFSEAMRPYDLKILNAIRNAGGHIFLHICKENLEMARYAGYPCDVVNWGIYEAPYSLEDGKTLFPNATVLGGLANRSGVLVEGSDEALIKAVHGLLDAQGERGFILGADCTLPTEIPYERIMVAAKAAIR